MACNFRFACQLVAGLYQIYSIISFVFYLCTFASPNFVVLVNLAILSSSQTNRLMYVIAQICFWCTYLWSATVLHLAMNWNKFMLSWPFLTWCVTNIIWETILIGLKIAFFEDIKTLGVIFWKVFNISIACASIVICFRLFMSASDIKTDDSNASSIPPHEETEPIEIELDRS